MPTIVSNIMRKSAAFAVMALSLSPALAMANYGDNPLDSVGQQYTSNYRSAICYDARTTPDGIQGETGYNVTITRNDAYGDTVARLNSYLSKLPVPDEPIHVRIINTETARIYVGDGGFRLEIPIDVIDSTKERPALLTIKKDGRIFKEDVHEKVNCVVTDL